MENLAETKKKLTTEFKQLKNKNELLKTKIIVIFKNEKDKLTDENHHWEQLANNYASEKDVKQENEWLKTKITTLKSKNKYLNELITKY